jgi:hypothetical protein
VGLANALGDSQFTGRYGSVTLVSMPAPTVRIVGRPNNRGYRKNCHPKSKTGHRTPNRPHSVAWERRRNGRAIGGS